MTDKEKIRAEIERRYADNLEVAESFKEESVNRTYFCAIAKEDYDLLSFIDSMQEEPKKDFRERYKHIAESESFKKAYEGMSIGEVIPVEGEKPQRIVSAEAKEAMYDKPAPVMTGPIGFDGKPMESKTYEQKHADNVEPKFHKDEWVVNTVGDTNQVVKVWEDGYTLDDNTFLSNSWATEHYHLWTIQYAKVGDVLSYRDGQWIFIYKGIVTEDTFKYYALLSEKGITVNDAAFSLLASCIIPATKEQRDLLFQKMREAGYEWDAEKKELKKVVQKPAWSEEDEKMLDNAIGAVGAADYYTYDDKQEIENWLKSLKDRYTWKPSDEQMAVLNEVINFAADSEFQHWNSFIYTILSSLRDQLKRLIC